MEVKYYLPSSTHLSIQNTVIVKLKSQVIWFVGFGAVFNGSTQCVHSTFIDYNSMPIALTRLPLCTHAEQQLAFACPISQLRIPHTHNTWCPRILRFKFQATVLAQQETLS